MMSSLLFYHKKENPLTGIIDSEGRRAQAVLLRIVLCVEGNSTSESREPKSLCPATSSKGGKSRSRGGGRGCEPTFAPLFFVGELLLLLLVRGEGKYEGAGALHCAPGRYTYSAVVYASRFPYAMHTPSECDGDRTHRSLGLETRPSKKRSPVELPGAVAPTGGCVLCSLIVQDRCVQAVQDGLFGAAFSGALIVLLRAFTRVGLVSSQGISPPSRRELRQ